MAQPQSTLLPFLYPCLAQVSKRSTRTFFRRLLSNHTKKGVFHPIVSHHSRTQATLAFSNAEKPAFPTSNLRRIAPAPSDYSRSIFVDKDASRVIRGSGVDAT